MMGAIISLIIAIITAIATYAVMRNNVDRLVKENEKQKADIDNLEKFKNENAQRIEYLMKACDELKLKAQDQSESITSLKEKVAQAPTMKEVRQEFVSKEMFNQMQKHIDEKFQMVQSGIQKILEKLD
jgi:predicted RND superfamily exporter protein